MSNVITVLLEGRRVGSEPYAFSREILFRAAGAWVTEALPRAVCGKVVYLCPPDAPTLAGAERVESESAPQQALAQYLATQSADAVLLITAPAPELTAQDYTALLAAHESGSSAVTRLQCAPETGVYRSGAIDTTASGVTVCTPTPAAAVTDGMSAFTVQRRMAERINFAHIARGVMIFAPDTTYIAADACIGAGTQILPGTLIRGGCTVGEGCVIGPNTILERASVGEGTTVNNSQLYESSVGAHATVGPFAYVRPGCEVGDHTRIGDFVELKKAKIGHHTKVSHLTYIGDAEVGERVNFGCGTVVVNYDGYGKYKTVIGDDCFIGCNTNLISPVSLGNRVFTAAGATITSDVPDGALAVARARQKNLDGWNDKRRAAHEEACKQANGK